MSIVGSNKYLTKYKPFASCMKAMLVVVMLTPVLGIAEARAKSECPPNPNNQIKKVVVISIDRNEKYYYHGEPINLHDISNEVILHNEEDANIQFLISADTNTPYGSVLRLVETLQRAQVSKIAMLGMQGYLCVSDLPVEYMTPESQHAADMAAQEAAE